MEWGNCTLTKKYYGWIESLILPWLQNRGFNLNRIIFSRLIFSLLVPLGFYAHPFWGLLVLILAGITETLQGYFDLEEAETSKVIDLWTTVIDRISDVFYLMGFWIMFWQQGKWVVQASMVIFVAILLCFLITDIKTRAEVFGVECEGGIMDRPTRVIYQLVWAFLLLILPGAREGLLWIGVVVFIAICFLTFVERVSQVFSKVR
jgi:phosphatidylglycerophosphate synthase